jgi:Ca2+:H+ antiporter
MADATAQPPSGIVQVLGRAPLALIALSIAGIVLTAGLKVAGADDVIVFVASAATLAVMAGLVGEGTDHLGSHFGPATTGILQSALGNLPELFISIFALREGLVVLTQTSLIGSILGNSLLVLGLAFLAGGLKHGRQVFDAAPVRTIAITLVLAVAALAIPTVSTAPGGPDTGHAVEISVFVSIVLLVVFVASIPYSLMGGQGARSISGPTKERRPLRVAIGVSPPPAVGRRSSRTGSSTRSSPMASLGWSRRSSARRRRAGRQRHRARRGHPAGDAQPHDLAISLIQNSSLPEVALALTPVLVLASLFISPVPMTLVLAPTLLVGLPRRAPRRVRSCSTASQLGSRADAARPVRDHRRIGLVRAATDGLDRRTLGSMDLHVVGPQPRPRSGPRSTGRSTRRSDRASRAGTAARGTPRSTATWPRRARGPGTARPAPSGARGRGGTGRLGQPRRPEPRLEAACRPAGRGVWRRLVLRPAADDAAAADRRPRLRRPRVPAPGRGADLR